MTGVLSRAVLRPGDWVSFEGGDHQVLAFAGTSVRLRAQDGSEQVVLASYPMAASDFAVVGGIPIPGVEPLPAGPRSRYPLLAVAFEQDVGFPPASARQLTQAIPGAELAVIPDAGHGGRVHARRRGRRGAGQVLRCHLIDLTGQIKPHRVAVRQANILKRLNRLNVRSGSVAGPPPIPFRYLNSGNATTRQHPSAFALVRWPNAQISRRMLM
jgi:hypothetical protein